MLSDTDQKIIKFFSERKFKAAKTSTIYELFYRHNKSKRYCQKRLKDLYEYKELKRLPRNHISDEYIYYIKHPRHQLKHEVLLTDFYRELHKIVIIKGFKASEKLDNLICDGIVAYEIKGIKQIAFVEIQTRHEKPDIEKYKKFYYSGKFNKMFPTFEIFNLICVTDRKVDEWEDKKVNIYKIKTDLSNINIIIEGVK